MGKQTPKALKPADIERFARQQNFMNNPNVSNAFGSTNTTFDANDQANIVQTLAPAMQGIVDDMQGFVGQGPAQLGDFSNPFIQSSLQGNSDAIARRGGYAPPDASQMGGYGSSNQQFGQPEQSMGSPGALPTVGPQQGGDNGALSFGHNPNMAPIQPQEANPMSALGEALSRYGGQGGNNAMFDLGSNLGALANRRKPFDPNDVNTRY